MHLSNIIIHLFVRVCQDEFNHHHFFLLPDGPKGALHKPPFLKIKTIKHNIDYKQLKTLK